ncbi:hypothetical protein ACFFWD_19825 [Bradyrhizobium erythrophlei]|uniref:hypothetical protein n=1 Tax=Bradyrhizobium erythrophlei TaxID=1437360 RepID=UPI0035EAFCE4
MNDPTERLDGLTDEQRRAQLRREHEEANARHAALPPAERHFVYEIVPHQRKPNWTAERNGLIGHAWINRFCRLVDAYYNFQHRHVFFVIERDSRRIAAGTLTVWRGVYDDDGGGWDLEGFVHRGDMNSQTEYETAVAVARVWGTDDERNWWTDEPFCYGDVCSFDRLVIDANAWADVEAAWQIIDALLKRIRRSMAVMVLKAFPLEYEGKVTAENRPAFERRQRALVRLYRRRIGFEPVPHKSLADEGWMMRLFNGGAWPDVE